MQCYAISNLKVESESVVAMGMGGMFSTYSHKRKPKQLWGMGKELQTPDGWAPGMYSTAALPLGTHRSIIPIPCIPRIVFARNPPHSSG